MYAGQLVELAALLALHADTIIRHVKQLSDSGLRQYWLASKARQERWTWALSRSRELGANEVSEILRPVVQEVLVTEILTRIWTAVSCECERRHGVEEATPLVRNVWHGHLEVRQRALQLLVCGHGFDAETTTALDCLRRRAEGWNDLLLGSVAEVCEVDEFAFSPSRTRDFGRDAGDAEDRVMVWSLLTTSLRNSFPAELLTPARNRPLNFRIAAGIAASFPVDLLGATGLMDSLWPLRMQHIAQDAATLIAELLDPRDRSAPSATF